MEPAKLASYPARFRQILDSHGLTAGFYGHCSVGCLHIHPFVDLSAPGQPELMRKVAEEVRELVRQYGGVNSSEHGDGLARSEFNRDFFGDELYAAMQETKRLFDPQNRVNPGKIVDAPAMTDHLRDAAQPPRPALATRLRFDAPGGMRGTADLRLRGGALRTVDAHRRTPALPSRPGRAAGDDHRGDRRFLPAADSARHRQACPASAGDRPGAPGLAAHQVITSPSEASHPDGRYVTCPVARSRLASFTEFVPLA